MRFGSLAGVNQLIFFGFSARVVIYISEEAGSRVLREDRCDKTQ